MITDICKSKKEFIEMLRNNGYSVTYHKVKEEYVFDWLINHTNLEDYDWKAINTIEDTENYDKVIDDYLNKTLWNK